MHRSFIALGGNVGDVQAHFADALRKLSEHPRVKFIRCSKLYRTSAVGEDTSERYLNAVAELETDVPAMELRELCHEIERQAGRKREQHWEPRPLDLDLILYDQQQISQPELTVPHIACWYRRFVLDPLVEIAPDVIHPEKQVPIRTLQQRLLEPISLMIIADPADPRWLDLPQHLVAEFPAAKVSILSPTMALPESPPTFLCWVGSDTDPGEEGFQTLPLLPRLDARAHRNDLEAFLRGVMQAAIPEEITPVSEPISL